MSRFRIASNLPRARASIASSEGGSSPAPTPVPASPLAAANESASRRRSRAREASSLSDRTSCGSFVVGMRVRASSAHVRSRPARSRRTPATQSRAAPATDRLASRSATRPAHLAPRATRRGRPGEQLAHGMAGEIRIAQAVEETLELMTGAQALAAQAQQLGVAGRLGLRAARLVHLTKSLVKGEGVGFPAEIAKQSLLRHRVRGCPRRRSAPRARAGSASRQTRMRPCWSGPLRTPPHGRRANAPSHPSPRRSEALASGTAARASPRG